MDNLVARQPIFDKGLGVFGYEIVYRSGVTNLCCDGDGSSASLSAIRNAFLLLGTKVVTGRRKIFLDFPCALIIEGVAHTLPSDITVISVVPEVEVGEEVFLACRSLKEAGYSLALDEASVRSGAHRGLLPFADIIKGPFDRACDRNDLDRLRHYLGLGKMVLAERVETKDDYEAAYVQGYDLFQGSFFSKPSLIRSREMPGYKLNYLKILQEVNRVELNFSKLEKAIKQDTSLCYTLLNYINSAYFGVDESILSVRHALVLLGEKEVRKWANLILFTFMGSDKPSELTITSLVRAKLCEALGNKIGMEDRASELFLMGMFSMLDVLMGRPMVDILKAIHLSRDVEEALLHGSNVYGDVFQMVVSYEMGNWEDFSQYAEKLGIEEKVVPDLYLHAVDWAETVSDLRNTPEGLTT
jgi:c-di-GMP-related signal transduction protein